MNHSFTTYLPFFVIALFLSSSWGISLAYGQDVQSIARIEALEKKLEELEQKLASTNDRKPKGEAPFKRVGAESDEDLVAVEAEIAGKKTVPDKRVKSTRFHVWDLRLGGRFFYDVMSPGGVSSELEDAVGSISSESDLRKCRIAVNGHSPTMVNFKLEFELAGGDVDYTDVYLSLPVSNIGKTHIGRQKEPFGMEQANSSNNLPFLERSLVTRSLMPGRSTGITFLHRNAPTDGISWQFGYFRNTDSKAIEDDKSGQNLTFRFQYDTHCVNQGRELVHFGGAYSHHHPENNELRIQAKTGSNILPSFADTGVMRVEDADIVGAEFAAQDDTVFFQAEWAKTIAHLSSGGSADFSGFYLSAGWFLTGEHKRYSNRYGALTTVLPRREFKNWRGGAWQLVTRYHELDLNDSSAGITGGKIREFDIGVNWYLHKDSRIMLNWLRPEVAGLPEVNIIQARFQVNF